MSTKIGPFEILSELAKSSTGAVYKANDSQKGQTIALKAIELSVFADAAGDLENALQEEAAQTKVLDSPNINPIYGAGNIEGKFCAAMEYVQGNSIATMLARKEGFSIWDLLDIGRQVCSGLDYAHSQQVFHYSLEPAKIMCGWDGTVKILGFGLSRVGSFALHVPGGIPSILHYMSPEQVRGEAIDGRSNLFSLGAIFYEMATDRRPFEGSDTETLCRNILEATPVPPLHVNPKIHPLLSDLILKALAKDPARRYQRGRELLDDLENCKESRPQGTKKAGDAAKAAVAPGVAATVAPEKAKAAAQAKFVASSGQAATARPPVAPVAKAAAAAVGPGSNKTSAVTPNSKPSAQSVAAPSMHPPADHSAHMSAVVSDQPEYETFAADGPKIALDPVMAEGDASSGGRSSFSDVAELPPLKEVYVAPEPPPPPPAEVPAPAPRATVYRGGREPEKPKVQPREVAEKAIKEIKNVPPRLVIYSMGGAVVLILLIAAAVALYIRSLNHDDDTGTQSTAPATETVVQPVKKPAPQNEAPPAPAADQAQPAAAETQPSPDETTAAETPGSRRRRRAATAPAVVPGQVTLDSTPQGAQLRLDGKSDPSWVTPLTISGLEPGQHSISMSKSGYSSESRTVEVASGSKTNLIVHLAPLMAGLSVNSNPAGAKVYVDGRDTGKLTPAQVSLDKGSHVVLVRKMGYLDETTTSQFVPGQTVGFSPVLRPLGNVDNIRTTGKFKKLFGGKGGEPGQVTVSIRTQPKGAQVAVNQRMLDKNSPLDVLVDPGNYVVDITLTGYAPVHKIVSVGKGEKVVVDETLRPR